MQAYLCFSLFACWVEGQKVRTVWCSKTGSLWRKTQKVRRREGEESESGVDGETEKEKRGRWRRGEERRLSLETGHLII